MSFVFRTVSKVFSDRPYLFNSMAGFLSFTLGDALAQKVDGRIAGVAADAEINVGRAVAIGGLGIVLNGFLMVKWFGVLDKYVGASMTSPRVLVTKTVLDQVVYAPFSISAFFAYTSLILHEKEYRDHKHPQTTGWTTRFREKMQDKFVTTFEADCAVWPMINLVQFRLVPLHLRPTVNGISALLWQGFLSHQAEDEERGEDSLKRESV